MLDKPFLAIFVIIDPFHHRPYIDTIILLVVVGLSIINLAKDLVSMTERSELVVIIIWKYSNCRKKKPFLSTPQVPAMALPHTHTTTVMHTQVISHFTRKGCASRREKKQIARSVSK